MNKNAINNLDADYQSDGLRIALFVLLDEDMGVYLPQSDEGKCKPQQPQKDVSVKKERGYQQKECDEDRKAKIFGVGQASIFF